MSRKFPINPAHPERVCWGCDLFCATKDMRCGNGSDRTMHPVELFGEGWQDWGAPVETPLGEPKVSLGESIGTAAEVVHGSCTDVPSVRK